MDGEIHVVSKPGAGSRFTFSIPLVLAEKADTELKDQSVFVNPYWERRRKPDEEHEAGDMWPKTLQAADGDENDDKPPDDDILDLLKYCEDKLNS